MTVEEMLAQYAQANGYPGGGTMTDAAPIAGDQFAEAKRKTAAPAPRAAEPPVPEITVSPLATPEEAAELKRLNRDIVQHRSKIDSITGPNSDLVGTNAKRLAAQPYNEAIANAEGRFNALNDTINARRTSQNAAQAATEAPFRETDKGLYHDLPNTGWGASVGMGGVTGLLAGLAGKGLGKSMLAGGGVGALDSVLAATYPTVSDSSKLPPGSPYQKEAGDWLYGRDPKANYWQDRVIPEVAMGTGLGAASAAAGGKIGNVLRSTGQGIMNMYRGARGLMSEAPAAGKIVEEMPRSFPGEPIPGTMPLAQAENTAAMPMRAPEVSPTAWPEPPVPAAAAEEVSPLVDKLQELAKTATGAPAKKPRASRAKKKDKDTFH